MIANVLGTEYEIVYANTQDCPYLSQKDGYTDTSVKKCVVCDFEDCKDDPSALADLENYKKQVTRHELIHAFLFESGLSCNSDWARNEEMIDFFAIQFPKIKKLFEELKIT